MIRAVMDNMDLWAYVIDMKDYRLRYINRKTEELAPKARIGDLCYQAFHGRESPCLECPMQKLLEGETTSSLIIHNTYLNVWTCATASQLRWVDGEMVCLMSCSDITAVYEMGRQDGGSGRN